MSTQSLNNMTPGRMALTARSSTIFRGYLREALEAPRQRDASKEGVAAVRELFREEAALGREVVANLVVQHGEGNGRGEGKGTPGGGGDGDGDGASSGGDGDDDGAASSVCFAVRGAIHPRNQLNLARRDRRRAAFSLVTDPLRHLFHGLMFDVPHDDLDAAEERAAVSTEVGRRAAPTEAAVGRNASSDVARFVSRAARLWRLCGGAAASAAGGEPAPVPAPVPAPAPVRRARVNVHRAPQAWHLSSVLRQIAERGGATSLDADHVWVLDDELPRGLPGLSALLGVPAIRASAGDSLSRRGAADALDQRMEGEEGWRLVKRHASRADLCALCHVLRADYACLPFARPRACDGC